MSSSTSFLTSRFLRLINRLLIRESERRKAVKLLRKILGNLRVNPTNLKFGDLNSAKVTTKLNSCRPALRLLFEAGFARSANGQRLKWKDTLSNRKRLADIDDALQAKEELQGSSINDDVGLEKQIHKLMQNGFSREEAEEAIKMSFGVDSVCYFIRVSRHTNCLVDKQASECEETREERRSG